MNDETLKRMSRLVNPIFLKTAHRIASQQATALTMPSSAKQFAEMMASQQAAMERALASSPAIESILNRQESLDRIAKSFYRVMGAVDQSEPEWLSELNNRVSDISLDDMNTVSIENDLEAAADQLDKVEDGKSFFTVFSKLHPTVQTFLCFLIFHVILQQLNSISANLLTPKVESLLESNKAPDREKIREIKQIPLSLSEVNTNHLRFITGNNVRLRAHPSTKSEILDELAFGQIVTVLSKERNWIEVTYEYENGEILSGWVFTRYTAKFVK